MKNRARMRIKTEQNKRGKNLVLKTPDELCSDYYLQNSTSIKNCPMDKEKWREDR
jgi:hypothetical protein